MQDSTRMIATAIIWGSFTLILISLATVIAVTGTTITTGLGLFLFGVLVLLMVGVDNGTKAVWNYHEDHARDQTRGKTKRQTSDRVQRLLEDLEDDEVYELEALLLAREDHEPARHHQR